MSVVTVDQPRYRVVARVLARAVLVLLIVFLLAALTGWGVLAVYYGDSHTSTMQTVLASGFGLAGFATLIGIWIKQWRRRFLGTYVVLFAAVLGWWLSISPSNDRVWQPELAKSTFFKGYAGVSLEQGNVWQHSDDIGFDNTITSGSMFVGFDTPIGPLYLAYGRTDTDKSSAYVYLGPRIKF